MSDYQEPEDIYEAMAALEFDEALESGDPRYVDTLKARGDFAMTKLYRYLRINTKDPDNLKLPKKLPSSSYNLFCGHIGCGKSTELRQVKKTLHQKDLFFVVFLDILQELDIHNLSYADVLLALAKQLFTTLKDADIKIDKVLLRNLESWFEQRIESHEQLKKIASEIRSEAKIAAGVPFMTYLFTSMTGYMQNNSTYKDEIRKVVTNSFSQFAQAFNQCLEAANDAVQKAEKGQRVLFIVDGTDRLRDMDGKKFFIHDVYQLTQIDGYFIYCSPIHLLYEDNNIHRSFTSTVLPMIKLHDRKKNVLSENYEAMREMVFKRFPEHFFTEPEALVNKLIEFSGGCPRELLRLIDYAYLNMDGDILDEMAVEKAINNLAVDYKRLLDMDDYKLLAAIDLPHQARLDSERIRQFLYNMIVVEYDNFWCEPHPAIRRLPGYQKFIGKPELLQKTIFELSSFSDEKESFAPPITHIELSNFTLFPQANIQFSPQLNIIIGENGTGKTHLLKLIYSIIASFETADNSLQKKLLNIFRAEKLTNLIRHDETECNVKLHFSDQLLQFNLIDSFLSINALPEKKITQFPVYFPTRELLSIFPNFVSIYENHYLEFDETWRDMCVLLGRLARKNIPSETQNILEKLNTFMDGKVELDENGRFYLKNANNSIEMHLMAEGLRKLGMLAHLLTTGCLQKGYLFWDEPEANLNPRITKHIAEIILDLCANGVQVFITTHSLFLLRELEILTSSSHKAINTRFIGLNCKQNTVEISQGDSIDDIDELTVLDEQLMQSDRYMDLSYAK